MVPTSDRPLLHRSGSQSGGLSRSTPLTLSAIVLAPSWNDRHAGIGIDGDARRPGEPLAVLDNPLDVYSLGVLDGGASATELGVCRGCRGAIHVDKLLHRRDPRVGRGGRRSPGQLHRGPREDFAGRLDGLDELRQRSRTEASVAIAPIHSSRSGCRVTPYSCGSASGLEEGGRQSTARAKILSAGDRRGSAEEVPLAEWNFKLPKRCELGIGLDPFSHEPAPGGERECTHPGDERLA